MTSQGPRPGILSSKCGTCLTRWIEGNTGIQSPLTSARRKWILLLKNFQPNSFQIYLRVKNVRERKNLGFTEVIHCKGKYEQRSKEPRIRRWKKIPPSISLDRREEGSMWGIRKSVWFLKLSKLLSLVCRAVKGECSEETWGDCLGLCWMLSKAI